MMEFGFVYMMYKNENDKSPVYVGFTTNPWQRFSNHFKDNPCGNGKLDKAAYRTINYIRLSHVGDEYAARGLEQKLINYYHPIYNTASEPQRMMYEKCPSECDCYWVGFKKEQFLQDKSVVFRCFDWQTNSLKMTIHSQQATIQNLQEIADIKRIYKDRLERLKNHLHDYEIECIRLNQQIERYMDLGLYWMKRAKNAEADPKAVKIIRRIKELMTGEILSEATA